jgi:hypothetical protein
LVEEDALVEAEAACLADEEIRQRQRLRDEARRELQDLSFQTAFAKEVTRLFPGCPPERADAIARHAGQRRSGRVGRTAAGRALDPEAVTLAVVASVRHLDTSYDKLLMSGVRMSRSEARSKIHSDVQARLDGWRGPLFEGPPLSDPAEDPE